MKQYYSIYESNFYYKVRFFCSLQNSNLKLTMMKFNWAYWKNMSRFLRTANITLTRKAKPSCVDILNHNSIHTCNCNTHNGHINLVILQHYAKGYKLFNVVDLDKCNIMESNYHIPQSRLTIHT